MQVCDNIWGNDPNYTLIKNQTTPLVVCYTAILLVHILSSAQDWFKQMSFLVDAEGSNGGTVFGLWLLEKQW